MARPVPPAPETAAAALAQARGVLARDPAQAAAIADAALNRQPQSMALRLMLGAARRRAGDAVGAAAAIAPLIDAGQGGWGADYEYAQALTAQGRLAPARAAMARACTANPAALIAWHALAELALLTGDGTAAAAARARAVALGLGDPALGAAIDALMAGAPDAPAALAAKVGFDARDAGWIALATEIGTARGRPDAAAALSAAALTIAPESAPLRYRHALALHRAGRDAEAAAIGAALTAQCGDAPAVAALSAAVAMRLGDETAAITAIERAIEVEPDRAAHYLLRGHAERILGRQAAAVASYRAAIARDPGDGEAWWSLANLKTWRFSAEDRARLATLAARDDLPTPSRVHLGFALAKAREEEGDDAGAFAAYRAANALRRAAEPWDADRHRDFVDATIAAAEVLAAREAATGAATGAAGAEDRADAPQPIFIVGMPRSGSTLIEQMLGCHPAVEATAELPYLNQVARTLARQAPYPAATATIDAAAAAALGADYRRRASAVRRSDRPWFTDKFPGNFLHIPLILRTMPQARIVDVRREAMACCVSLYRQCFAEGQAYSYDLTSLGRYFRDYARLMARIDALFPGRVLTIGYEALIAAPEAELARLLDFVGLAPEPRCLRFFESDRPVRTASSEQVRRPLYRDAIDSWRRFSPWLEPLASALAGDGGA